MEHREQVLSSAGAYRDPCHICAKTGPDGRFSQRHRRATVRDASLEPADRSARNGRNCRRNMIVHAGWHRVR